MSRGFPLSVDQPDLARARRFGLHAQAGVHTALAEADQLVRTKKYNLAEAKRAGRRAAQLERRIAVDAAEAAELKATINGMSGWQRGQWQRAGSKPAEAEKFSKLERPCRKGNAG